MTQTDCMNCDFSENCDWGLITQNMVPMSPPCVAKAWHEKSLKKFEEQKDAIRERIEQSYRDGPKFEQVKARIVTVGDFCKVERDFMGEGE